MEASKIKQDVKKVASNNWFLFKIFWKAAPLYVCFYIFENIRSQLFIFIEHIYGIGYILNAAEHHEPFIEVARFIIILFIVLCICMYTSGIVWQKIEPKGKEKILRELRLILYEKAKDMDLIQYDTPEFYNDYVLIMAEVENQMNRMIQLLRTMFCGLTMFTTTGTYFLCKDKAAVIFVLVSFIGSFVFTQKYNRLSFTQRVEKATQEKKLNYVNRVFYLNDYAKEHRLNPEVSEKLYGWFEDTTKDINQIYRKYGKKRFLYDFLRTYVFNNMITDVLLVIYLVYEAAVLHRISYSTVIILFNASGVLREGLTVFIQVYPFASESSLYIEKIRQFLKTEPKIKNDGTHKMPEKAKVLEFRNVSFAYTKDSPYVIHNLSLKIHPYEKIALVGYNGAGKTTLIKLLMRLYDVTEGEILYDGINIKDYDLYEYRKMIGAVFQDYVLFGATLKENVVLSHAEQVEDRKVLKALEESGFSERLKDMAHGLQTDITTEFAQDGVNLSGGESQKVAIARAFYGEAQMMILDEPSSALDPIAEYQLNHSMMKAANHKTVVFISHRLSTTRLADKIIMLESGSIIESGTHLELLSRKDGAYAKMWRAQAGQYIEVS